jgi:2-methylcitrate dehydratase PrpD
MLLAPELDMCGLAGSQLDGSGPYAVAVGLFGGHGLGAGLEDYTDELARDPERRALMEKVDVVADDRCTAIFPRQFPVVLTARLADGSEVVEEVLTTRGGPERPLSFAELTAKFRDNVARTLPAGAADELARACDELEECTDLASMLRPLAGVDTVGAAITTDTGGLADGANSNPR